MYRDAALWNASAQANDPLTIRKSKRYVDGWPRYWSKVPFIRSTGLDPADVAMDSLAPVPETAIQETNV